MKDATDFLYPFIEGDETDSVGLLDDLARSAGEKWAQSAGLRIETLGQCAAEIAVIAEAMVGRFNAGGRMYAFGNGGSATDADGLAHLYNHPPAGRALPCRSLTNDTAILTALGNDVGFDKVFSRQIIAHARPGDIAVGYSTSGNSQNLLVAMAEAHKRGLLTVGLAGIDGGQMAVDPNIVHCLVVRSQSVHRVQEAQAALTHELWRQVQSRL